MNRAPLSTTTGHTASETDRPAASILSQHVRCALREYFMQLDGCDATDLYTLVLSEVEQPLIETVLEHCGHNQSKAAQILGLSRSTLRKKMTQYGIE
jgi:Fis family transcriptional regulator